MATAGDVREDTRCDVRITCPAAPVQIEGTIDGYPFYFRSRWSRWTFTLVEPGQDPVAPGGLEDPVAPTGLGGALFWREDQYGSDTDVAAASWMPHEKAWWIVSECAAQFRAQVKRQQQRQLRHGG
jgi:hypothetical protein